MEKKYTHRDQNGMGWRFEGMRPISSLADEVMAEVEKDAQQALTPSEKEKQ